MIKNLKKEQLKNISESLPSLQRLLEEDDFFLNKGIYKKTFASIFDHWLKPNEVDQIHTENADEINNRRKKFETVVKEIFNSTEIYLWRYKRHDRFFVYKPTSINEVLNRCDFDNLYSERGKHYSLILPEYSAVFNEEWDWTNIIWYINKEKIKPLIKIIKKAGLHILE